jgi:hypothetical protein
MAAWALIRTWWRARQRAIDLKILWPLCVAGAADLDYAKAAFTLHAWNEPAWRELGADELLAFIDQLGPGGSSTKA